MNYSLVKALLEGLWDISPQTLIQYEPIARGIMNGLEFVNEQETNESIPFITSRSGYDSRTSAEEEKPKEGLVSVIPLVGVMLKYDTHCGPVGTMTIAKRLEQADSDPAVLGHVLLTDSGGGESMSVNPLSDTIKNLTKPIIGYCNGYMCSAAVGVNVFCNEIYASNDHDIIGSVGTMIGFNARENNTMDENKVKTLRIYSTYSPDKNSDFEEALKGNFKLIRDSLLDPLALKFINTVKANRPNVTDDHVTGKVYMAHEVVGIFIDGIKSFNEVIQRVAELSQEQSKRDETEQKSLIINQNTTMKQFPKINQAIGVESLESTDEVVALNDTQMQAIEENLPDAEKVVKEVVKKEVIAEVIESVDPRDEEIKSLKEQNEILKNAATPDNDVKAESDTKKSISDNSYFENVAAAKEMMDSLN